MSWRNIFYLLSIVYVLALITSILLVPVSVIFSGLLGVMIINQQLFLGLLFGFPFYIIFLITGSSQGSQFLYKLLKWLTIISVGLLAIIPFSICKVITPESCSGDGVLVLFALMLPVILVSIISSISLAILKTRHK